MPHALFFPSYFGSGFGHVSRCLTLAGEMSRRGWKVGMVLAGAYVQTVEKAGFQVFKPRFPTRPRGGPAELPAYTYLLDGNIQTLRDGFVRPWRFYAAVMEAMRFVKRFRPNVLVGDFSLLTWVVGRRLGLPVVQIAQSISHPVEPRIIWWEDPPSGMISPDIKPVFNSILKRWKLDPVNRVEELLQGELFLIPSIPELEPVSRGITNTHYVGPLLHEGQSQAQLPEVARELKKPPLVYVTLGGSGAVDSLRFFDVLNSAFEKTPWSVIVSAGRSFDVSKFPPAPSNIQYYPWVDGPAITKQSDVVVFHGGHGTMVETIYYGIPSVVLPSHSERECNGRRLEACSAGLVLSPISNKDSLVLIRRRWRYGEYTTWIRRDNPLTPEMLREATSTVLSDPRYSNGAQALSRIARRYGGAATAVGLIEGLL